VGGFAVFAQLLVSGDGAGSGRLTPGLLAALEEALEALAGLQGQGGEVAAQLYRCAPASAPVPAPLAPGPMCGSAGRASE
jgi:hypothetical protein